MSERPKTNNLEAAEQTAKRYLANLGLAWDELRGKHVLDIGVLNAEFETAARLRGVEVISVDNRVEDGEYAPPTDSRFILANATKLPVRDLSFDYALGHMSVMNYREDAYNDEEHIRYIEDVLREVCRVLKTDGQFRFTETSLDDSDLQRGEDDVVPDPTSDAYIDWHMTREQELLEGIAKRVGFSELRLVAYPDSHPEKEEDILTYYFNAVK